MICADCEVTEAVFICKDCDSARAWFCKECSLHHARKKSSLYHEFAEIKDNLVNKVKEDMNPIPSKCSDCELHDASYKCLNCVTDFSYFCEDCLLQHSKKKIAKSHEVLSISAYRELLESKYEKCPAHEKDYLTIFCSTCKKILCEVCRNRDHKYHHVIPIEEESNRVSREISEVISSVKFKNDSVLAKLNSYDEYVDAVRASQDHVVDQIHQTINDVIHRIRNREKQLVEVACAIAEKKCLALQERQNQIEKTIKSSNLQLDSVISTLQSAGPHKVIRYRTAVIQSLGAELSTAEVDTRPGIDTDMVFVPGICVGMMYVCVSSMYL